MKAYLRYAVEQRTNAAEVIVYSYYQLENDEWLVQSKRVWKIDENSDYYRNRFGKFITTPFKMDPKYDYDIRSIILENSIKDIESDFKIPVTYVYKCPWSGQRMEAKVQ